MQRSRKSSPARWKRWLLAVASTVLALAAVEAAYRVKLMATVGAAPLGMSETYRAANAAAFEFDRELGYRYRPGAKVITARITAGRPVLLFEQSINSAGDVGQAAPADAEVRLMVCGDSFTAMAHDGQTWPELAAAEWEAVLRKRVGAANLARDGYGVLQMFDLAAARVEELRPDVVLICFIADDLTRARVWRGVSEENGQQSSWLSTQPTARPSPAMRVEGELIDSRITREWFENARQDPDDPLLAELNGRFDELRSKRAASIDYFDLSRSFLYHRLLWADPFFGMHNTTLNPRIRRFSYAEDERLQKAISRLQRHGAKVLLVQLPQYEDFVTGRSQMSRQQNSLRTSLEQMLGSETHELLARVKHEPRPERLFLLPHDRHPSLAGLLLYARAVVELLQSERVSPLGDR